MRRHKWCQITSFLWLLVFAPTSLYCGTALTKSLGEQAGENRPRVHEVVEEIVLEPVFQGKCHVFEAGQAHRHTVVLIHGLGGTASRDWGHVIPKLTERYHVVTFDLPGFGRSQQQNVLYSPANYAAFVKWIVDARVEGPFTLVGHSMGGVVALRFSATYPRNLRHLILVDAAGILHRSVAFRSAGKFLTDSQLGGLLLGRVDFVNDILGRAMGGMENRFLTPDAEVILASHGLREKILRGQPDLIAGLAMAQEDFSRRLEFVTQPVSLLWGSEDKIAPLRTAKSLVARLPNARLVEFEGLGHSPMLENPELFDKRLIESVATPPAKTALSPSRSPSTRVGRFADEYGRNVSGTFGRIEIENCEDLRLDGVTAQSISVTSSTVSIENSRIEGGEIALKAYDSHITMTGGILQGDVAIVADSTELDLAGVTLRGKQAVVRTEDWTKLVLSISKAYLGDEGWYLHGIEELYLESLPWPKSAR